MLPQMTVLIERRVRELAADVVRANDYGDYFDHTITSSAPLTIASRSRWHAGAAFDFSGAGGARIRVRRSLLVMPMRGAMSSVTARRALAVVLANIPATRSRRLIWLPYHLTTKPCYLGKGFEQSCRRQMEERIVSTDRNSAGVQVAQLGQQLGWQVCRHVLLNVFADGLRDLDP